MSEDVSAISPSRAAFLAAAEAKAAQIAAAAAKISPEPSDPRPDTESLSSRDNVLRNNVTASDSDFVSSSENGDTSSKIASSAMSSMSSSDYSDSSDDDLPATNPCQPIETNVNIASVTISISPQLTPVMKSNLRATYSNSSASSTPITPTAVGPYSPSHRAPARVSSILKRRDSESVSRGSSAPPSPVPSGDRERSVSIDEKRYDESRLKRYLVVCAAVLLYWSI
jgi:hypothetical protein